MAIGAISTFALLSHNSLTASATNEPYKLVMNSSKNKLHNNTGSTAYSGETDVKTNLDNDITFSYTDLMGLASTWHVAKTGGQFYNVSPLHGLESISLSFKTDGKDFKLYWSNTTSFNDDKYQVFTSSTNSSTTFNFNGDYATYFKFVNISENNLNISEVELSFSCENHYSTLSVVSEDVNKGAVSGGGLKISGEDVTITASTNSGYAFSGWYKGSILVSSLNPYTFSMPYENTTYTAKFSTNSYDLTLINDNSTLGSISSSASHLYGSSVTIVAIPNTGVSFLGWYDGEDTLVSSLISYTFNMPHEDLTYHAKFAWTPYSVSLSINDDSMGSVSGAGSYIYQQEVTLVATPNEHYSFFGWYEGETLLSQEVTYVFNMPDSSLDYEARFVQNHNLYVYSDDESKGTVSYPNEWGEGLEVTIIANAYIGYALDYWYDDDLNEVSYGSSYTFVMPNHDVTLYAAFTTGYTLTVTSSDETKGTVTGGGVYVAGRNITVTMTYIFGTFKGWFDGNDQLVSMENPFMFTMPFRDYSLEATFMSQQEEWDIAHGVVPTLSNDGKTVTYGLYPQTNVNDSSLISALNSLTTPESNGWYLYEGEYYAKVSATPYGSGYKFDNGTTIVSDTTYWFKCEPIIWNVLNDNNGEYYILSSVLLDTHYYYGFYDNYIDRTIEGKTIYANNYKYSEIRTWLNDDFYNSAFALNNSYIQTTNVDNSASTTNSTSNQYACENTQDKVFLPSYQDYINSSYGFSTSTGSTNTRYCRTTDWARARGSDYITSSVSSYQYTGYYWTRSPDSEYFYRAWIVYSDGYIDTNGVSITNFSVRPSLTLLVE